MKIVVTVTNELDELWADADQFEDMSDAQVVELIKEDVTSFMEGASWTVTRE